MNDNILHGIVASDKLNVTRVAIVHLKQLYWVGGDSVGTPDVLEQVVGSDPLASLGFIIKITGALFFYFLLLLR